MKSVILAGLLSLITAPLYAQDQVTLMLDWFVNPDHGPVIIAQEKGYFAEQNLEVQVIAPADPSAPPKMVAAGPHRHPRRPEGPQGRLFRRRH